MTQESEPNYRHRRAQNRAQNRAATGRDFDRIVERARLVDVTAVARRFTTLRRASTSEWCGPCPRCGGEDRFHCTARWWFCRVCHPRRSDAIGLVMWQGGADFRTAAALLAEATLSVAEAYERRVTLPEPPQTSPVLPEPEWMERAGRLSAHAQERLHDDPRCIAHRSWLHGRGLAVETWQAFGLGAGWAWSREAGRVEPCIVIPWLHGAEVCGLRYRFLAATNGQKLSSLTGSSFSGLLFGEQAQQGNGNHGAEKCRTLLLCEGELNAASIHQVAHRSGVSALSVGSESQRVTERMADAVRGFRTVIVWMDRPDMVQGLLRRIPGACGVSSPNGSDANDELRAGRLAALVAELRLRSCRNRADRELLLADLRRGAAAGEEDAAVRVVMRELAMSLNRSGQD